MVGGKITGYTLSLRVEDKMDYKAVVIQTVSLA